MKHEKATQTEWSSTEDLVLMNESANPSSSRKMDEEPDESGDDFPIEIFGGAIHALVEKISTFPSLHGVSVPTIAKARPLFNFEMSVDWDAVGRHISNLYGKIPDGTLWTAWADLRSQYVQGTLDDKVWEPKLDFLKEYRFVAPIRKTNDMRQAKPAAPDSVIVAASKFTEFKKKFGAKVTSTFLNAIAKHPDFYTDPLWNIEKPRELEPVQRRLWARICTEICKKFIVVSKDDLWEAWACIRAHYFADTCPVEWRGTIAFMNDIAPETRRLNLGISLSDVGILLGEMAKYPWLYSMHPSQTFFSVGRHLQWKAVLKAIEDNTPGLSPNAVWTTWANIRTAYVEEYRIGIEKWNGSLMFLDGIRDDFRKNKFPN